MMAIYGYDGYVPRFLRMLLGLRHLRSFRHCQVRAWRNDLIDGAFLLIWSTIGLLLFTFTHSNRLHLWNQPIGLLMFPFTFLAKALLDPCVMFVICSSPCGLPNTSCQFSPIHLRVEWNQYKPMHIFSHINTWIPVSFSWIQWEISARTHNIHESCKIMDPCLPQLDPLRHLDDPIPENIGWFVSVWQKVKPISGGKHNSCEEGWTVMGASIVLVFISVQSWFQTYSLSISNHPYIVYQIYKDSVRSSKRKVAKRMMTKSSVLNIQAVPGKWRKRKAQVGFVWLVVPTTAPLLHPLRLWLVVSPRPYRLPSLCQASNINRWKYKEFHKSKCENISEHFPAKYFVFPCRDLIWLQN